MGNKLRNNCQKNEHSELTWEERTNAMHHLLLNKTIDSGIVHNKEGQVSEI